MGRQKALKNQKYFRVKRTRKQPPNFSSRGGARTIKSPIKRGGARTKKMGRRPTHKTGAPTKKRERQSDSENHFYSSFEISKVKRRVKEERAVPNAWLQRVGSPTRLAPWVYKQKIGISCHLGWDCSTITIKLQQNKLYSDQFEPSVFCPEG